jgi:type I restriction enzyme S subunit
LSEKGFNKTRKLPKGSILVVCIGSTIGKVGIAIQEMSTNQQINSLICSKEFDNEFVYYALSNAFPKHTALIATQAVPIINKRHFSNFKINIPSLPEQHHIAEALSNTDELIVAMEKLIAKKRVIKQGTMQELLTGKRRLPGFSGKWVETTLGEICEIKDGTHQTPKYEEYGIPFYSVENITNNNFTNTKYISFNEHQRLTANYKIERGDILMTRIGSIGVCKYVDWNVNASFYVSLALLKCTNTVNAKFLSLYSQTEQFQKEIDLHSLQHAIPKKINLGNIALVRLPLPTIAEQTAIASILSDMDTEIDALTAKMNKLRNIKQGMMSELLTGRIRLTMESSPK